MDNKFSPVCDIVGDRIAYFAQIISHLSAVCHTLKQRALVNSNLVPQSVYHHYHAITVVEYLLLLTTGCCHFSLSWLVYFRRAFVTVDFKFNGTMNHHPYDVEILL